MHDSGYSQIRLKFNSATIPRIEEIGLSLSGTGMLCLWQGLKKILFVSDFRPTLSKHVRPKFILWISKKKKNSDCSQSNSEKHYEKESGVKKCKKKKNRYIMYR